MSVRVCKLQSQKSILERGWEKVTYWHIVSKTFIEVNIKCFFLSVCLFVFLKNLIMCLEDTTHFTEITPALQ